MLIRVAIKHIKMAISCVWSHFPRFSSELFLLYLFSLSHSLTHYLSLRSGRSFLSYAKRALQWICSLFQSLVQLINVECERAVILTSTQRRKEKSTDWKKQCFQSCVFFYHESTLCCLTSFEFQMGKRIRSKQLILIRHRWLQYTKRQRRRRRRRGNAFR